MDFDEEVKVWRFVHARTAERTIGPDNGGTGHTTGVRYRDMAALHRMSRGPARYLIMAGDKGQESFGGTQWDGSLFTHALLNGLRREADLYKDHIVTARELYVWLKPVVEKEAERAKRELTPMFKDLGPGGSSPGDFVFVQ